MTLCICDHFFFNSFPPSPETMLSDLLHAFRVTIVSSNTMRFFSLKYVFLTSTVSSLYVSLSNLWFLLSRFPFTDNWSSLPCPNCPDGYLLQVCEIETFLLSFILLTNSDRMGCVCRVNWAPLGTQKQSNA